MSLNPDVTMRPAVAEPGATGSEASRDAAALPTLVIEPAAGWSALHLAELWPYRELLLFLTWRDIQVRYKQTMIGAAWAVLQPGLTMVVFSAIFGRLVGVPSEGVPYPVFAYAGLLPWTFFATALQRASGSLVNDASLISKVYFPRLILPTAAVLAMGVDFAIAFVLLLGLMLVYGLVPGLAVVTLPLFALLAGLTALGVSLWCAALNVRYRDVGHALPFLTQFWLFVTPVAYPSSLIPARWQLLYGLNPMAGVVEGFRWALLGQASPPSAIILVSTIASLTVLVSGLFYFRRMENEFADMV